MFNLSNMSMGKFNGNLVQLIKVDGVVIWEQNQEPGGGEGEQPGTGGTDFTVLTTDFSVKKGSVIEIVYTTSISASRITVAYDSTKFTKNGNKFTVLGDGLNEITYKIDGKTHTVIRVATATYVTNVNSSTTRCEFNSDMTLPNGVTFNSVIPNNRFYMSTYGNPAYTTGLVNKTASDAYACIEFDYTSGLGTDVRKIDIDLEYYLSCLDYNDYGEVSGDYACFSFRDSEMSISDLTNTKFGTYYDGNVYKYNIGHYKATITTPGKYYLYIKYREYFDSFDDNNDTDHFKQLCLKALSITPETAVNAYTYPATRIEGVTTKSVLCNEIFNLNYNIYPSNSDEKLGYVYNSSYISRRADGFKALKPGDTFIIVKGQHATHTTDIHIDAVPITSINVTKYHYVTTTAYDRSFKLVVETVPKEHSDGIRIDYDENILEYSDLYDEFYLKDDISGVKRTNITFSSISDPLISTTATVTIATHDAPYVTYTLASTSSNASLSLGLPSVGGPNGYVYSAELTDGTVTNSISSIPTSNVKSVKLWYDTETTTSIAFPLYTNSIDASNMRSGNSDFKLVFDDCRYLKKIDGEELNIGAEELNALFYKCYKLRDVDLSGWNIINATNLAYIFGQCYELENLSVSNWDVSKVTNFSYAFQNCYAYLTELDLSGWRTSSATNLKGMFYDCYALKTLHIENFTIIITADVTDMFRHCEELDTIYCNYETTITKLVSVLPSRGTTNVDPRGVIYTTANIPLGSTLRKDLYAKNWFIEVIK